MARLLTEGFEGTGYENVGWAETVDAGCTLNEDSTDKTPPNFGGVHTLKSIVLDATYANAFANYTLTDQNISYVRAYIYVDAESFADDNSANLLDLYANAFACGIQFRQVAGAYGLRFRYYSGGAIVNTALVAINLQTWYLVEFKYDVTNMLWEWKINKVSQHNGSLTSATRTPYQLMVGIKSAPNALTVFYDLVGWDTTTWIGSEIESYLTESLQLAESLKFLSSKALSENISLADVLTKLISPASKDEALTITDVCDALKIVTHTETEEIIIGDFIETVAGKNLTEGISVADVINLFASIVLSLSGVELVANGAFETDPNVEWSPVDGTIALVAGGQSGNCLEITRVAEAAQSARQAMTRFVIGKRYKISGWVKSGTSGNEEFQIGDTWHGLIWITGTSSATWTYYETIFIATFGAEFMFALVKNSATPGTMLFDQVSIQEVEGIFLTDVYNFLLQISKDESIVVTDSLFKLVSKTTIEALNISDMISSYVYMPNVPLSKYGTRILIGMLLDSGTLHISSDDIYITES